MIILGTNSIKDTGYDVANSCRFDSNNSDYLSRTPGSASNRKTFTFSFWVKRTKLSTNDTIYNVRPGGLGANRISFHSTTNTFRIALEPINKYLFTNRKFTDTSAWYNMVVAFDTTQATASNRIRLYVNGVEETSFGTSDYPNQDTDLDINTTNVINLGRDLETSSDFIDMYLAEFVFIDGQQLAPTSFGEFDEDSGIWKPIDVSGLTFGTNGFYLDFEDSSALGNDAAGSNNFTVNNLTAIDQSTDTCTNNFATLNTLNNVGTGANPTYSEGNLKVVSSADNYFGGSGNFGVTTGKWYLEVKVEAQSSGLQGVIGMSTNVAEEARQNRHAGQVGSTTYPSIIYNAYNGTYHKDNAGESSYGNTYTSGDIIGVAVDLDNNKLYFSKNGVFQNSGNPESGATGTGAISLTATDNEWFLCLGDAGSSTTATYLINFGSPSFSISSGNADGDGYGNFEYAVPNSYYSLCSKNLAEYG